VRFEALSEAPSAANCRMSGLTPGIPREHLPLGGICKIMTTSQILKHFKLLSALLTFFTLSNTNCLQCQNGENRAQTQNLTTIECWEKNASAWDVMSGEGRAFQVQIVDPVTKKLLPNIDKNTKVLEIACGNGFLARRLAKMGADVLAIDASANFIELAKQKTDASLKNHIQYQVADATDPETYNKITTQFDCVISNMSIMDIADIKPLFQGASKLLKPQGSFIVTQTHPCFEKAVGPIFHEIDESTSPVTHTHGVKVIRYLQPFTISVKADATLPQAYLFFHRSLSTILQIGFQAGFVVDGFEEIAFSNDDVSSEHSGRHLLTDIPVVVGIRFKKL
jgi:2-polyprenyl-3-methyl-5-hydroxy-6-metoxy-1,4-benzoquinol methylase